MVFWAILLAIVPLIFWFWIFYRSDFGYLWRAFVTFILSLVLAGVYFYFLTLATGAGQNFNMLFNISLPPVVVFVLMGGTQEYAKNILIRLTGRKFFESMDDVIELALVAALGFAFVENLLFFLDFFAQWQGDYLLLIKRIVGRMFYVVPIQILCSGIFGYFYGLGLFAKPLLQEQLAAGQKLVLTKRLHQILHLKSTTIFAEEKIMEGFVISMLMHGIYAWLVHFDFTVNEVLQYFAFRIWPVDMKILPFIGTLYFTYGSIYLFSLLEEKKKYQREDLLYVTDPLDEPNLKTT